MILGFGLFSLLVGLPLPTETQALNFLKTNDACEFSFFISMKGHSDSVAWCVGSYTEGAAIKRKFCMARIIDLETGDFIDKSGRENFGSFARYEGESCSLKALKKIYGPMLFEPKHVLQMTKGIDGKIIISSDDYGFKEEFLKRLKEFKLP